MGEQGTSDRGERDLIALGPQGAKEKAETSEQLGEEKREHVGDSHSRHRNVKGTLFEAGGSV